VAQQIVHTEWLESAFLPLKQLLKVRAACQTATPMLRELIGLHVAAHKTLFGSLFMFAKALEVVGRYYGQTRATRNNGLQNAMQAAGITPHLKRNVEWLFETTNTRFDIRHAIDDRAPGVSFHPKLTAGEWEDFEDDATLIVRAFICNQLGVETYIVPRK
jgi:hypothetical protein